LREETTGELAKRLLKDGLLEARDRMRTAAEAAAAYSQSV